MEVLIFMGWSGGEKVLDKLTVPEPPTNLGAPAAQWIKRWPTDLADRVRSSLEVKSSQP